MDHKNVENSDIRPDSETLTSNTRELVDSNFKSFIQALIAEALGRGVRVAVPYENGGIMGGEREPSLSIIEKIVTHSFSSQILVKISQSSFP